MDNGEWRKWTEWTGVGVDDAEVVPPVVGITVIVCKAQEFGQ